MQEPILSPSDSGYENQVPPADPPQFDPPQLPFPDPPQLPLPVDTPPQSPIARRVRRRSESPPYVREMRRPKTIYGEQLPAKQEYSPGHFRKLLDPDAGEPEVRRSLFSFDGVENDVDVIRVNLFW